MSKEPRTSSHKRPHSTSWEEMHDWYDQKVGEEGHYYHQHVILPNVLRLLNKPHKLLDVGCGQGILARKLPKNTIYWGLDLSSGLIERAKKMQPLLAKHFLVQDATQPFTLKEKDFSHATIILALQNMANPATVLQNIEHHLGPDGSLLLVLNHPCFRIPRQSGWIIDNAKKLQSRRIDRYTSPLEIPIQTHPGAQEKSSYSLTFHLPLSAYCKLLHDAGFVIEQLEEWCSDKTSTGPAARMENRARQEFPLFLAILARKKTTCYLPSTSQR